MSMEEVGEVKAANSAEPSSSEGVARMDLQSEVREGTQESGVPDCSSSDQVLIFINRRDFHQQERCLIHVLIRRPLLAEM